MKIIPLDTPESEKEYKNLLEEMAGTPTTEIGAELHSMLDSFAKLTELSLATGNDDTIDAVLNIVYNTSNAFLKSLIDQANLISSIKKESANEILN